MNPIVENPLTWVYFPTALLLGALHALEPGHAKTLTAAYLIGIKGTKKDALLLGLSVALTHSIVVVGISALALYIGRETFTQDVTRWLQIGSGIIVILLGFWLMVKRIRQMNKAHSHHHHHASEKVHIESDLASGLLEIVQTDEGERMRYSCAQTANDLKIKVIINRPQGLEILELVKLGEGKIFQSAVAPSEPHEFSAELEIVSVHCREVKTFEMHEDHDHHDHDLMSDDEHARAHAASIPEYAKKGERPTSLQILSFGAAGGMIPCPASITVMLLALSIGKVGAGLFAVAGFSIGLAVTLVGIGLVVVVSLNKIQGSGRFQWVSSKAPIISAGIVMLSGIAALVFTH
ncbi:sulfite exporter TauE/SafE family protein [Bacteriovorax sp. PP10]|uniref:Nickel/cobalt efflux system n=1 Tax=Bacteriovorax antarcticus TaxID=3088717 RepID=A0ABU5W0W9_9BACT|nr:sulfite exporter TauE/SafE family protein [Bacteriovorax sp. PP10]MEA9358199.1 sulfite exporter TauE/SafE family protein [Bacteriovorax sp. PP10]